MVEVIWTEPALSDLNDIAEYIGLKMLSQLSNGAK